MQREITGFRDDDVGDWVAELQCHHRQHVRRREQIGTSLDCPLCDRAELPAGLVVVRTAGPYDESTLPAGLRRNHRVADGVWGMLRLLAGSAHFTMQTVPVMSLELCSGDNQPIPPGVFHAVALTSGVVEVDFLVPPDVRP